MAPFGLVPCCVLINLLIVRMLSEFLKAGAAETDSDEDNDDEQEEKEEEDVKMLRVPPIGDPWGGDFILFPQDDADLQKPLFAGEIPSDTAFIPWSSPPTRLRNNHDRLEAFEEPWERDSLEASEQQHESYNPFSMRLDSVLDLQPSNPPMTRGLARGEQVSRKLLCLDRGLAAPGSKLTALIKKRSKAGPTDISDLRGLSPYRPIQGFPRASDRSFLTRAG